ncbi:MAG: hypothetical protein ABEK36_04485, partial [Candidatus Aenigmatarchaeota archaeon]
AIFRRIQAKKSPEKRIEKEDWEKIEEEMKCVLKKDDEFNPHFNFGNDSFSIYDTEKINGKLGDELIYNLTSCDQTVFSSKDQHGLILGEVLERNENK